MTQYVVAFNGPPGSGKDTAAGQAFQYLTDLGYNCFDYKMSMPLKFVVNWFCLVPDPRLQHEELKPQLTRWSTPDKQVTFRQAYIDFSERWAKELWGQDIFARWAINQFEQVAASSKQSTIHIISDAGFVGEQVPIIDWVTPQRYAIARMQRPGHTFAGDSRSYFYPPQDRPIHHETIYNDSDIITLSGRVMRFLNTAIQVGQWTPKLPE